LKQAVPLPIRKVARSIAGERRPVRRPVMTRPSPTTPGTLDCCVAYNELGGYCIPTESIDRPSSQRIMGGGVWEPDTLALIERSCGTGDIVHAGTYFGDFLPLLSRSVSPDATVWAFEPNPVNVRCAEVTIALNGLENIELINAGLGARSSSAHLRVRDASGVSLGGGSRVVDSVRARIDASGVESIRLVAIDEVVPADREVSIVQLDVEGFQHEALSGAFVTIERCRPLIIVEKRIEEDFLAEHLDPLGYRRVDRVGLNSVYRAPRP
jgi:FkbM family methyltransferase